MKYALLTVVAALLLAAAPAEAKLYTPGAMPVIINDGGLTAGDVWAWFRKVFKPRPVIINDGG